MTSFFSGTNMKHIESIRHSDNYLCVQNMWVTKNSAVPILRAIKTAQNNNSKPVLIKIEIPDGLDTIRVESTGDNEYHYRMTGNIPPEFYKIKEINNSSSEYIISHPSYTPGIGYRYNGD